MIRTYRNLPDVVTGYPLDDVWSVVVPIATTNIITNPSFETNTTSWTAIGGSIARSTSFQYHGAYSLAITPTSATTDGARYDTVSLTSGVTYGFSAKVKGVAGLKYKLCIETTGGVELTSKTFTASGRWDWIGAYWTETSTTTRRFTVRKAAHASTAIFYLDGAQMEIVTSGNTFTTYCDGDQLGHVPYQQPPAYYWNGTPHASTSSRSGLTRAGGMVIPFRKYGFILTAIVGLGLAVPQNVATEYARIDGGYDDYTRKPTRQFSLAGRFQGTTYAQLRDQRGRLSRLFDRDLIGLDQRLTLLRHIEDRNGVIVTSAARITAKYESGLGGNTDNQVAETAGITFTNYLPLIGSDNEAGTSLSVQTSISNGLRILQRSPTGVWSNLSTGANNNVWSLFYASDGKLYAGGEFTSIGGVAADRIAYWDGTAWNAMGTGMAGVGKAVYGLAEGPDGSIYASGDGSDFGGIANTAGLGKWNGSVWSSITAAGSANAEVVSLKFDSTGKLLAGGNFTTINGVAAARIASWDGATWTALGAGIPSAIAVTQGIAIAPDGYPVVAETSAVGVKKYNGSTWTTIGAANNTTNRVVYGPDGTLYASGSFTSIGGVTAAGIAKYNGVTWVPLGSGLAGGTAAGYALAVLPDGTLLVGGSFTSAGGITTVNNLARWNGSAWVFADVDIAWTSVRAVAQKVDGTLAIGGTGATSTGVAGATTTVTNTGTARSYPTIVIDGPSSGTARIYQITNYTTGRTIYLNYTINTGETARLVFTPDNLSFISDFQGNIAGKILAGSNEADFFLQPGANIISFFSANSTVTATIFWRPNFASLDDVP